MSHQRGPGPAQPGTIQGLTVVGLMTTSAVDARLATDTAAVDRLGTTVFDLDNENPTRTILATTPLTGVTSSRWEAVEDCIRLVWVLYGALRAAVDQAAETRGHGGHPPPPDLQAVAAILSGPVVTVPDDAMVLASRHLPVGASVSATVTIDDVLDLAAQLLAQASDLVGEVTRVWDELLPRLAEFDAALDAVEASAAGAPGGRAPNELAIARRGLAELRHRAASDPLAIEPGAADQVGAHVERARALVDQRAEGFARVGPGRSGPSAAVPGTVAQLAMLLDRAAASQRSALERIAGAPDRSVRLTAARTQLEQLQAAEQQAAELAVRDPEMSARRMAQVDQRGQILATRLHEVLAELETGIAERDELRGRLRGYQALARAQGRAEDGPLHELAERASDLLYAAPCDLDRARRAVEDYQRLLTPSPRPSDAGDDRRIEDRP